MICPWNLVSSYLKIDMFTVSWNLFFLELIMHIYTSQEKDGIHDFPEILLNIISKSGCYYVTTGLILLIFAMSTLLLQTYGYCKVFLYDFLNPSYLRIYLFFHQTIYLGLKNIKFSINRCKYKKKLFRAF